MKNINIAKILIALWYSSLALACLNGLNASISGGSAKWSIMFAVILVAISVAAYRLWTYAENLNRPQNEATHEPMDTPQPEELAKKPGQYRPNPNRKYFRK